MTYLTVSNARTRGNEPAFASLVKIQSVKETALYLLEFEFGYGGEVTDFDKNRLEVTTLVMGCIDKTTIEGTEEDMELILEIARAAGITSLWSPYVSDKYKSFVIDQLTKKTDGNPLMIEMGSGVITGKYGLKSILLLLINSVEHMAKLATLSNKDLLEIYAMLRFDGIQREEVFSII